MFAYGVNTNVEHLAHRCPNWSGKWKPAILPDHTMRFDKAYPGSFTSFCNIKRQPGATTYGILLWLDPESFALIDAYEGYPRHYDRRLVDVICDGKPLQAWAYWSKHRNGRLNPSDVYFRNVMRGLVCDAQAPDHYIDELVGSLGLC